MLNYYSWNYYLWLYENSVIVVICLQSIQMTYATITLNMNDRAVRVNNSQVTGVERKSLFLCIDKLILK